MNRSRWEAVLLSIRYMALMKPDVTVSDVLADLWEFDISASPQEVDEMLRTTATERTWVERTDQGYQGYRSLIYLDEVPF